jgi:hypothetical protein
LIAHVRGVIRVGFHVGKTMYIVRILGFLAAALVELTLTPPQALAAPEEGDAGSAAAPISAPFTSSFGLRGMSAATGVRAETAYGLNAATSSTVVQYMTASYAPVDRFSVFIRGGWIDLIPNAGGSSSAFANVAMGGLFTGRLSPNLRVAGALGSGFPSGQGGGDSPDKGAAAAIAAGNLARSRFEGSTMFSPNDLAPFVGADIAWVSDGFTVQLEASVFEAIRVRGAQSDPDAAKTALTAGLHAGYFFIPQLSFGIEVRDQTFLSTPAAVEAGKTSRVWVTVGGGPRVHIHLGGSVWLRPGLAYIQPLNDPSPTISASSYHILQLDLPLTF